MRSFLLFIFAALTQAACASTPVDAVPVSNFDGERYLGKWYEIARLDHGFERGLSEVTATYSRRDDGGIKVENTGCKAEKAEWENATGKAYFTKGATTGQLKVSFFGPFYGKYIVFDLDQEDYEYAYISGGTTKYLWLLARKPEISKQRRADFISKAKSIGYATDDLIWVEQTGMCG
ncbi:MAG: lipocalin [Acidimicrobiales bacterium]|nr:lipocalin [Hyphomonadaceae bacterium]RZV44329.1 MAG: lipocalin [Acidimicrobiales bacterium]